VLHYFVTWHKMFWNRAEAAHGIGTTTKVFQLAHTNCRLPFQSRISICTCLRFGWSIHANPVSDSCGNSRDKLKLYLNPLRLGRPMQTIDKNGYYSALRRVEKMRTGPPRHPFPLERTVSACNRQGRSANRISHRI
jgi:hypothetical protein